jgi:hypothetical protein
MLKDHHRRREEGRTFKMWYSASLLSKLAYDPRTESNPRRSGNTGDQKSPDGGHGGHGVHNGETEITETERRGPDGS